MDIKRSGAETPIADITKIGLFIILKLYHPPLLKEYILDFVSLCYRSNGLFN